MSGKIELAKSSRAGCRTCKQNIDKGEPRFGEESIFRKDGKDYISYKWHHMACALEKHPEKVIEVSDYSVLEGEILVVFNEIKEKYAFTNFGLQDISEISGEEGRVDVQAKVLRIMPVKETERPDGSIDDASIVYLQSGDDRVKLFLWITHELEASKDDTLYIKNIETIIGSDDYPELHESVDTKIQVNKPFDNEEVVIEKYFSDAWERPKGKFIRFEHAKSSRASCVICNKPIEKGDLKLVKPVWGENEYTGQAYPQDTSYHVLCAYKDEHGNEVVLEGISRLNPVLLKEERKVFQELLTQITGESKKLLGKIL